MQLFHSLLEVHRFTPTVVHGDIKGANILISEDDSACLCDFGLSAIVGEVAGSSNFTSTFAGSLRWTAPELIQPNGQTPHVTTWSDIYALGSVTYEVPLRLHLCPLLTDHCCSFWLVSFHITLGRTMSRWCLMWSKGQSLRGHLSRKLQFKYLTNTGILYSGAGKTIHLSGSRYLLRDLSWRLCIARPNPLGTYWWRDAKKHDILVWCHAVTCGTGMLHLLALVRYF